MKSYTFLNQVIDNKLREISNSNRQREMHLIGLGISVDAPATSKHWTDFLTPKNKIMTKINVSELISW